MSAHAYHPQCCGCASCCDNNLRDSYMADLTACPDFIAGVPLNREECIAAAKAVNDGDMTELGRLFIAAIEREASECIAVRAEECGITTGEAAKRIYGIYRPQPDQILRGNADLVPAQHDYLTGSGDKS